MAKPKEKKCKNPECGERFAPFNSLQKVCGKVECALVVGRQELQRRKKQEQKEYRSETRERKKKLKTVKDWLSDAQKVFNRYINLRDKDLPCISCGASRQDAGYSGGGVWNASHYRSRGACSSLRFDEDNVHKSCAQCNTHKSGNIAEYTPALIDKIGQERFDRIKNANPVKRWTIEEAKAIKAEYTNKIKEIEGR